MYIYIHIYIYIYICSAPAAQLTNSLIIEFNTQFIETINADDPTQAVIRAAEAGGLDTIGDREPMSFSEDFAHFCAAKPGCFLLLGNGEEGPNSQPLHSNGEIK